MVGIVRRKSTEQKEQIRFVQYVRTFMPDIIIASIPNGAGASASNRFKLVHEGLLAGMPDLILLKKKGGVLFLEFKRPDGMGRVSKEQQDVHERLHQLGFAVKVVERFDEAVLVLNDWREKCLRS
jgi:hypothetical protein